MKRRSAYSAVVSFSVLAALAFWFPGILKATQGQDGTHKGGSETTGGRKVVKTDAQWRKLLRRDVYEVTRQKATEPPFSGKFATSHASGIFTCACCNAELFSSKTKFDSGTGWPSFWRPIDPKSVETAADYHMAEPRIEVLCRDCGAHLGHVFDDGPAPTGLRYCLNSLSLKLVPPKAEDTDKAKASAKANGKSKTGKTGEDEPESESTTPSSDAPKGKSETPPRAPDEVR